MFICGLYLSFCTPNMSMFNVLKVGDFFITLMNTCNTYDGVNVRDSSCIIVKEY